MSRRCRAWLVATLAATAVLGIAVPAQADQKPTLKPALSLNPPPDANGVISSTDTPQVIGGFEMASGVVDDVKVTVTSAAKPPAFAPQIIVLCTPGGSTDPACGKKTYNYAVKLPKLPKNGPYTVQATAGGTEKPADSDGRQYVDSPKDPVQFKVNVKPAAPTDVKVAKADKAREATVTWARNSEPDLQYYALYRKNPGAKDYDRISFDIPQPAEGTARVSAQDKNIPAPAGTYNYAVVAVRAKAEGAPDPAPYAISTEAPLKLDGTATTTTTPGQPGATTPSITVPTPAPSPHTPPARLPSPIISHSGTDLSRVGGGAGGGGASIADGPFSEELPYGVTPSTEKTLRGSRPKAMPLNTSNDGGPGPKAVLIPLAAGAALLLVALQLRWLSGRAATEPDLTDLP